MTKKSDAFNDFVNFIEGDRSLSHLVRARVIEVAETQLPHKLKFSTLESVMEASQMWDRLKDFSWKTPKEEPDFEFDFEGSQWTGTILAHTATYGNQYYGIPRKEYFFINVKLPNDGYVYSKNHDSDGNLKKNQESLDFVRYVSNNIQKLKFFQTKPIMRFDYDEESSRVTMYYVDVTNSNILTIKFEYGRKFRAFNKDSFEDWSDSWQ